MARNASNKFVVTVAIGGFGANSRCNLRVPGRFFKGRCAQGNAGQNRRASCIGLQRILDLPDGPVQHVGMNLAPYIGVRSTANHVDGWKRPPDKLLDVVKQPAGVAGYSFEYSANQVGPRMVQGHIEKTAACFVVIHRGSFPVEPRRKNDAVAARRRPARPSGRTPGRYLQRLIPVQVHPGDRECCLFRVAQAGARRFLFVDDEIAAGNGRWQRGHIVGQVGFLERARGS